MRRLFGLAVAVALGAGPAAAQVGANCPAISDAYEAALKDLAYASTKGMLTRSAPQATQTASEQMVSLARAQANLDLLIASRCPLPKSPVSEQAYMSAAADCALASDEAQMRAKCARSEWKPAP